MWQMISLKVIQCDKVLVWKLFNVPNYKFESDSMWQIISFKVIKYVKLLVSKLSNVSNY